MAEESATAGTPPPTDTEKAYGSTEAALEDSRTSERDESTEPTLPTRPKQVVGSYPVRQVIWLQISTSDIRSIGIAQLVATISSAIGTFALSVYLDFSKDLTLDTQAGKQASDLLNAVVHISYWSWIIFWIIAAAAFIFQGTEYSRLKAEHGLPSVYGKIKSKINKWLD